jgi:hypothetical protein
VRLLVLIAAALIGCTGSGDDDSLGGEDGGSESSSSGSGRGRAGSGGDDDGDDVGELGARAGRGGAEDAGAPVESDAATMEEPGEEPEPCKPGEVTCIAGSCTRCESGMTAGSGAMTAGTGGTGAAGGTGGSSPLPCLADADDDGTCDEDDACPNASDRDADANGYADACDQVLWSDEVDIDSNLPECALGSEMETWFEVRASNGQIRSVKPAGLLAAGSFSSSIASDATTEVKAASAALMSGADLATKVHARVDAAGNGLFATYKAGSASLNGSTIRRFVFRGSVSETCASNGAYALTGLVRWEIRGY